ncbi:MAG: glycosyltransferase [Luteitalea sp.]|nr:glycosyltransferase [Luteitalea sp.]
MTRSAEARGGFTENLPTLEPVDEATWRRETCDLRVAIVHDWLTGTRGGERLLEAIVQLFPRASLFALVHARGSISPTIERLVPHTSAVQWLPRATRWYRHYLPLFPWAVEQWDLDNFDLVVSSSHCAAKSAVAPGRTRHLCYCHTPVRYAWDQFDAYFDHGRTGAAAPLFRFALASFARWDRGTSGRPDRYVANSQYVARRIGRYYNRRAAVVHPPVDTGFFQPDGRAPETFYLVVSALVPYKRVEVAIEACRRAGRPLKIVGEGPERPRLQALAHKGVEFVGSVSDEEVRDLYRRTRAVLLPGEEDFGLVPLEAQACGRAVVALGRGGACESVVPEVTGVLTDDPTVDGFTAGLARFEAQRFAPEAIRRHAERFSLSRFFDELRAVLLDLVRSPVDKVRW